MNSNLITESETWPTTDDEAPAPDHGSLSSLESDGRVVKLVDLFPYETGRQETVSALLGELTEGLAKCPTDQLDPKLQDCLNRICESLASQRYRNRLAHELKCVIQVLAAALASNAEEALAQSRAEIQRLKAQLRADEEYVKPDTHLTQNHEEVLGKTEAILRVLCQVERVAPADCSVLIHGETGTGKELIAQQIHRLSPRKGRAMVRVNCAALPPTLVESELFGRERGAYTGALTSQVGRFEVANGSTIFLDEVGELPLEVQAKLLRVLQEGEFQRLGSPKTYKANVRVIAASNRDLAEEVRKGKFREDLYYRLKVFPIVIPPLRDRVEDIPLLVFEFVKEFGARMGKKIARVSREGMEILQGHRWPGNIRELRNVIERSVILTTGHTLKVCKPDDSLAPDPQPVTLEQAERHHILKTLESTSGRIKGPNGAAKRLGVEPSTLYSRMHRLGIPIGGERNTDADM